MRIWQHFWEDNDNCHVCAHLTNLSIFCCNIATLESFSISRYSLTSSAYILTHEPSVNKSATLCGWRRCFVADQLGFMLTCIREEKDWKCHHSRGVQYTLKYIAFLRIFAISAVTIARPLIRVSRVTRSLCLCHGTLMSNTTCIGCRRWFLPRDAYAETYVRLSVCLSICLSVRPSHAGIESKRLYISSKLFYHRVAPPF